MDTEFLLLELRGDSGCAPGNELRCIYHPGMEWMFVRYAARKRASVCMCKDLKTWHEMKHLSFLPRCCRPKGDIYSKQQSNSFACHVS